MTVGIENSKETTIPERPRRKSSPNALKVAAEDRMAQLRLLEQGPVATEEAASLADRQFWRRGDKIDL